MRFSTQVSATAFLAASSALGIAIQLQPRGSMSSQDVVNAINAIREMSAQLANVAQTIQFSTIPTENSYEPVIDGFNGIINTANSDITIMKNNPTSPFLNPTDSQPICDAFHNFVTVHQDLLKIVIGQSGLLQSIFLGSVAAVLRSLEGVVDTLANGIIALVPGCSQGATTDLGNLDATIKQAICYYTPLGPLGITLFCDLLGP